MNYTDVVSTALSYADRQDDEVVSRMDTFLRMVESRINRLLQIDDMQLRYQFPEPNPLDGRFNLPLDYAKLSDIAIVNIADPTSRLTLSRVNQEQMNTFTGVVNTSNSAKHFYQIIAGQVITQPIPVDGIDLLEIVYYGSIIPLTPTENTNWLSYNHPDLYVDGLLTEINSFVKDAQAASLWNTRFVQAIEELKSADVEFLWSGTPLATRVE
jgi:hypothetical protein